MDDFLENMPVWYENLLSDSLSLAPRSHDVLEAVVGIGGLVFQRREDEAFRLGNQLRQQIIALCEHPGIIGELDSTQLKPMLNDESYPASLRTRVRASLEVY